MRFVPKLLTVLREGYDLGSLRHDAVAGLTVAIVALPLAMALAVASGTTPDKGLVTAVVAGFLISALGGSRFQIGGPTGAFIPVVYAIIASHGYDGLVIATLMAGILLIAAGLLRVGALMKYMPQPLVTGFTTGIAVIIFASQLKDLLGLPVEQVPAAFIPKLETLARHLDHFNPWALVLSTASVALIAGCRRWAPRAPGFLLAVAMASLAVALFKLPVDTIGSRFGGIPSTLPMPTLPGVSLARLIELIPSALTIAFLAGVESLLSAVVADGMTGGRHRSNTELIAQGIANSASALVGGLPATGAIARTATNVRAGGRTPFAGILHALFLLLFMLALARLASYVPLPALAGVLVVVAWNMSEREHFLHTLSAPKGDRAVLLATFGLTVLVDLTLAIEVGMVIAAFVFMARMAEVVEVSAGVKLVEGDGRSEDDSRGRDAAVLEELAQRERLPPDVAVYRISGPLFFGASSRLESVLDEASKPLRACILRMRLVPIVDASGVHALKVLADRCQAHGIALIISGLQPQPRRVVAKLRLKDHGGELHFVEHFDAAVALAHALPRGEPRTGIVAPA
jgi:SulP family sulfate permease